MLLVAHYVLWHVGCGLWAVDRGLWVQSALSQRTNLTFRPSLSVPPPRGPCGHSPIPAALGVLSNFRFFSIYFPHPLYSPALGVLIPSSFSFSLKGLAVLTLCPCDIVRTVEGSGLCVVSCALRVASGALLCMRACYSQGY